MVLDSTCKGRRFAAPLCKLGRSELTIQEAGLLDVKFPVKSGVTPSPLVWVRCFCYFQTTQIRKSSNQHNIDEVSLNFCQTGVGSTILELHSEPLSSVRECQTSTSGGVSFSTKLSCQNPHWTQKLLSWAVNKKWDRENRLNDLQGLT